MASCLRRFLVKTTTGKRIRDPFRQAEYEIYAALNPKPPIRKTRKIKPAK